MDLDRLIAAEERNEARVSEARVEAAALVAKAKADGVAREAADRDAITRALAEVEQTLARERVRAEAVIHTHARDERARYEGVTDTAIAALMPALVGRLLAEDTV